MLLLSLLRFSLQALIPIIRWKVINHIIHLTIQSCQVSYLNLLSRIQLFCRICKNMQIQARQCYLEMKSNANKRPCDLQFSLKLHASSISSSIIGSSASQIFTISIENYNPSMNFIQKFKTIIYPFDLFCSSQLLRYNQDTQYKTLTGGLLSLGIIIVIIVGFASMISQTLNRSTIISSLTTVKQSDPPLAILLPNKENMFMLGLSIQSIDISFLANLSALPKFFDVNLNIIQISNGNLAGLVSVGLEQCTKEHWSMMPGFDDNFDSFGVSNWLCLPLNYPLAIQGTYSSPTNLQVLIEVLPCNNQTSNNSCTSQQQISALFAEHGNFYLNINYINSVINPNEQQPVSYYIEANDYVIFSDKIGSQAWVYFSDFSTHTDNSIWPYSKMTTKKGCIVESKAINHPYTIGTGTPYASVYLAKSVNSLIYSRQVQKISAVFSYIGGLVGAITAILFLIKMYTDISLEITIGLHLFQSQQKKKEDDESGVNQFNFYGFMCLTAFRVLKIMGWQGEWKLSSRLEMYQNQAVKQLDVQILLKRIIKLETCMTRLLTKEQLEQIKADEFISLKRAQKMRSLLLKDKESLVKTSKEMREVDSRQKDAVNGEILIDGNSQAESNKSNYLEANAQQKSKVGFKFRQNRYPSDQIEANNERNMVEDIANQKLFGLSAGKPTNRRQLPAIFAKNAIQPE